MNIGFDAKRAFHNSTGLGNYSRTLINSLAQLYPEHDYILFNPKSSTTYHFQSEVLHEIGPTGLSRLVPSIWRSNLILRDLSRLGIQIYHGLSHELPFNIHTTEIKSVVTIHDLIPERFPEQYSKIDSKIYHKKFFYSCKYADKIIAISEQTKRDIIEYYKIAPEKIIVCYQSCHPAFGHKVNNIEKEKVIAKYSLPPSFYLTVGSIIERKNLLSICKALTLMENNIPLVIIGEGKAYKEEVKKFINNHGLESRVIFLSEQIPAPSFEDMPAIYQLAIAMIYPSTYEGFGLPVLEALLSGLPVITSNVSCLPEAGGDAAFYVDPLSSIQIANAMTKVASDMGLVESMKQKGWIHAQKFTPEKCASDVMHVYQHL